MKLAVLALGNAAVVGAVSGLGLGDIAFLQLAALAAASFRVGEDGGVGVVGLHGAAGLIYGLDLPVGGIGLPAATGIPLFGDLPSLKAGLGG